MMMENEKQKGRVLRKNTTAILSMLKQLQSREYIQCGRVSVTSKKIVLSLLSEEMNKGVRIYKSDTQREPYKLVLLYKKFTSIFF